MLIDCTGCPVRGTHCDGCMVTGLLATIPLGSARAPPLGAAEGIGPSEVGLDRRERAAVTALVSAGLVSAEVAAAARAVLEPSTLQQWRGVVSATG